MASVICADLQITLADEGANNQLSQVFGSILEDEASTALHEGQNIGRQAQGNRRHRCSTRPVRHGWGLHHLSDNSFRGYGRAVVRPSAYIAWAALCDMAILVRNPRLPELIKPDRSREYTVLYHSHRLLSMSVGIIRNDIKTIPKKVISRNPMHGVKGCVVSHLIGELSP